MKSAASMGVICLLIQACVLSCVAQTIKGVVKGVDVGPNDPKNINWRQLYGTYIFAYIQASVGDQGPSSKFDTQFAEATDAEFFVGTYHVARPDKSPGMAQASTFLANRGGWEPGKGYLPGALYLAPNSTSPEKKCYGKSPADMVQWIKDFVDHYTKKVQRNPVISTTTDWWQECTARSQIFANNPLWITRFGGFVGPLPAGWAKHTFWEFDKSQSGTKGKFLRFGERSEEDLYKFIADF